MTRAALIALVLLAAAPAIAGDRPIRGVTCYDPGIVTDCRAHWSGSRGGGEMSRP